MADRRGEEGVELKPGKPFTLDTAMGFYFLKKLIFISQPLWKGLYIAFSNAQMTIALQLECFGENFPLISFTLDCIVLAVFFFEGGMFKQNFISHIKISLFTFFVAFLTSRNKPLADGKGEEGGWAESR